MIAINLNTRRIWVAPALDKVGAVAVQQRIERLCKAYKSVPITRLGAMGAKDFTIVPDGGWTLESQWAH